MTLEEIKLSILGDWEKAGPGAVHGRVLDSNYEPVAQSDRTTSLTLIGSKRLDEFCELIETVVRDDIPGHIVETGVWRGGACIWAAAVLESLGSDKLVYVCDSFQGLPPVTSPKETVDFTQVVSLQVSQEQVRANFRKYNLLNRAVFVEGWFRDTMPGLDIPVAVLRLDGDMYESTDDVLRHMYDRVSPGGFIIIDDYELPSCRLAVDELRSRKRLRGKLKHRAGVWWRK